MYSFIIILITGFVVGAVVSCNLESNVNILNIVFGGLLGIFLSFFVGGVTLLMVSDECRPENSDSNMVYEKIYNLEDEDSEAKIFEYNKYEKIVYYKRDEEVINSNFNNFKIVIEDKNGKMFLVQKKHILENKSKFLFKIHTITFDEYILIKEEK